jgi:hypothetical protein
MEKPTHSLASLFDQLGLESTESAIMWFVKAHSPVPDAVELHEAACWSTSQAAFLKQAKEQDADWAAIVDQLDVMLRAPAAGLH